MTTATLQAALTAWRIAHPEYACPAHGPECNGHLPAPRYIPMPPTHKPDDDDQWASDRDCDRAADAYYAGDGRWT